MLLASPKQKEMHFQRISSLFSLFRSSWLALQRAAATFRCIRGWFDFGDDRPLSVYNQESAFLVIPNERQRINTIYYSTYRSGIVTLQRGTARAAFCVASVPPSLDLPSLLCLRLSLLNLLIYTGRLNDSGFRWVSEHASKSAAAPHFSTDRVKSS